MASPWFTPGASTASWFAQQPGSAAAAATSPQQQNGYSPFLGSIFGQNDSPPPQSSGIGPAPAPLPSGPDNSANAVAGLVGQYGRPIASALGTDYSRGLGGLLGLTNLGLGVSQGNPVQAAGGGISALGGFSNLLASSPQLASSLGLGSLGTAGSGLGGMSALGSIGAGAGGLGGLLGIYGGIQGLMNGGSVPSGLMQLGSGLAGTYGALSSLAPSVFPSLTAALASAVPSLAPAIAGSLAAAPVAGMVAGPYVVAKLIQAYQALGPDKANARQLNNRVQNIYGQLPGELSVLAGIPGITGQLTPNSTPEQAADVLKQLNNIQSQYQAGGWESHQKTGQTSVQMVGDQGGGSANLPDVQRALDLMNPQMQQLDLARLRAEDILGRAGWTPDQIQAQTGRYIGPQEWAMGLNAQTYTGGSGQNPVYNNFNPTFNAQFRPDVSGPGFKETQMERAGIENTSQLNDLLAAMNYPGSELTSVNGYDPRVINAATAGAARGPGSPYFDTNFGTVNRSMWDQLAAIQPGNFEKGLSQFLQPYGGVSPGLLQLGFGR